MGIAGSSSQLCCLQTVGCDADSGCVLLFGTLLQRLRPRPQSPA
jgi:hypothetical protein